MTDSTSEAAPAPVASTAGSGQMPIPWFGLTAVLMGTFISTLNGRLSSFGLADIRGAVHAGFDEGAWITTAQTAAQMLIAPFAVWAGSIFGPRRVLMAAALAFAATSSILPLSQNLATLLIFQFLGGLASGCFIPLTLSFVLRNMPPHRWAYGIALYALNLELSLNISASLEGWYVDNLSWRWIFWQNVPLALAMAGCLSRVPGLPRPARINADLFGLASCGLGLALFYAALDQGNRLDWLNSGLVWGLMLAGVLMLAAFVIHEQLVPNPWLDFRAAFAPPLPVLLLLIALLRLNILSTAFLIPQYLGAVRGFRALQVGQTLIWIALPQLIICPLSAYMLRRTDPRFTSGIGLCLIGAACMMVATGLTPLWGSDQFLPSQLLQAVGQSFALSGIVFNGVMHLRPQDALAFGAMLQTARLMGGEIGQAAIATFVRVREQRASNLIGTHLHIGDMGVVHRLAVYGRVVARLGHPVAGAPALLVAGVRRLATTQGVIDGFVGVAACAVLAMLLLVLVRPPPVHPAAHRPWFRARVPA